MRKGARGEAEGEDFLRREKGYRIVCRNWRSGKAEIDLVCLDGAVLVFVEVRARQAGALVPGYHSVSAAKKRVLRRGCLAYLDALRERPEHFRFDIVEVRLCNRGKSEINHYENVTLFSNRTSHAR